MAYPILMTGVTPAGMGRAPLHPDDADRFSRQHDEALRARENAFSEEMQRLEMLAGIKKAFDKKQSTADREGELVRRLLATGDSEGLRTIPLAMGWPRSTDGPVDQQASLDAASRVMRRLGATQPNFAALDFDVWRTSQPRSRNALYHAMLIPENALLQSMEALSGMKSPADRMQRLMSAVPGSFYPPAGYAVEPARDRMYEELGPVGGMVADYVMPGPGEAVAALRMPLKAADKAFRNAGRVDLVDQAGETIRRLSAATQ